MPLTPFQKQVARILAKNRNPESYVAGGAVINRDDARLRISDDLDIFHDVEASVAASAEADVLVLRNEGFAVEWASRDTALHKAVVTKGSDLVRLDWVVDSAFRFFPAEADEDFGFRLHQADLATNKVLALVGRAEIRDFLDVIQLDQTFLSLGATMWAACGKDPGYTPSILLNYANRHARYQEADLLGEHLVRHVSLQELKIQWLTAMDRARELFAQLPPQELGCLYLDQNNNPVTPDPTSGNFSVLIRHRGSIRGAWPIIS